MLSLVPTSDLVCNLDLVLQRRRLLALQAYSAIDSLCLQLGASVIHVSVGALLQLMQSYNLP